MNFKTLTHQTLLPAALRGALAFLVLGILSLVSIGAPAAAAPEQDRVTLQLKWRHQFQFAGYYAALYKGYYWDAGLDVEIREANEGEDPIQQVLAGRADFGVGTSELLLLRNAGKPVVVLAVIFQHSPLALVARRDSGIRSLHDLGGKRVMIEPNSAELFAYLQREGIASDSLQLVTHNFNVQDPVSYTHLTLPTIA